MLVGTNREGRTRLVTSGLDRSIRFWDIATGRMTYAMHALDYAETIISAISANRISAFIPPPLFLLRLDGDAHAAFVGVAAAAAGGLGIIIPPGPIARPDEGLAPGLLARALHHLSKVT